MVDTLTECLLLIVCSSDHPRYERCMWLIQPATFLQSEYLDDEYTLGNVEYITYKFAMILT